MASAGQEHPGKPNIPVGFLSSARETEDLVNNYCGLHRFIRVLVIRN